MSAAVRRTAAEKLASLRAKMAGRFAAYVVPTSDAHNSEYVSAADKRREYISGFTGSAGTAVITAEEARLWTDGRYFLQADKELDAAAGWKLMKDRLPETPSIESWLSSAVPKGQAVGLDPFLFPIGTVQRMKDTLEKAGVQLDARAHGNLVDAAWGEEAGGKPAAPRTPVFVLDAAKYAGRTAEEKLADVRAKLAAEKVDALVVCALDEIAWLFNIRGADVECNPVTIAYALLTPTAATLFIDSGKLDASVSAHLAKAGVTLQPYDGVLDAIKATPGRIWMDPAFTNYAIYQAAVESGASSAGAAAGGAASSSSTTAASASSRVTQKMSPIQLLKATKNDVEIAGFRAAHLRDGAALTTFFAWLDAAVNTGIDARTGDALAIALNEVTVAEVLESFRREREDFVDLSFPTIAGAGANGAIIHYHATPETAAPVTNTSVFLCDSGAQYKDGTTDVTRTLHFGAPTDQEKHCYTRVLQGHIALARARFPTGASGVALDSFARAPLWQSGLDYRHGTGHGVGSFLNVHEGPFGASPVARTSYDGGIFERYVMSNEPGYYHDGAFGIRIENLVVAKRAETPYAFGTTTNAATGAVEKPYLEFETLTMAPITTRLVDAALLSAEEKAWLNGYHAAVREKLTPLIPQEWAREYLRRETEPVA